MATNGEYITKRLMPDLIEQICHERGISIQRYSDDWVLRLERDGVHHWIVGYTFSLNSASATEVANDKVATYQALGAAQLPAIEHYLARSRATPDVMMQNLTNIPADQPVLTKPLQGASGHGIHLFPTVKQACDFLANQIHTDWTISPWYDIVSETRFILSDGEVLCCYDKQGAKQQEDGLLFYNLSKGARAVEVAPDPRKHRLAVSAAKVLGLRLAAVDIAVLADGSMRIVEVNAGFMMENFIRQSDEYKNRAREIYDAIIAKMFE